MNHRTKASLLLTSAFLFAFILIYFFILKAGFILQSAASEPMQKADLLVILGGGWIYREQTGLALLQSGMAERTLLTGILFSSDQKTILAGDNPPYDYLLKFGINKNNIIVDSTAKNTWEEIILIRNLLLSTHAKKVIIVTDPPHIRRVQWAANRILNASGIESVLVSTQPSWWNPARWWTDPTARYFVTTEYLKLIFYFIRYGFAPI